MRTQLSGLLVLVVLLAASAFSHAQEVPAPALASGQTVNAPDRLWAAQPQSPPSGESDWGNLRQLRVGDKVEVVRYNLSKHKGKMLAWTEESISLRLKNRDVTISREEVYRVTQLSKGHRGRNVLIGLGLGAAVGTLIGRAQWCSGEPGFNACTFVGLVMGTGIGAGVGAAFPNHPTIYRASRRKSENRK